MFRVLFGFVLGALASYYALPIIYQLEGPLPQLNIERFFADETVLDSNTINPEPPSPSTRATRPSTANLQEQVSVAASLARLDDPQQETRPEVMQVLVGLAEIDPRTHTLLREHLPNGLSNQEALTILAAFSGRRG